MKRLCFLLLVGAGLLSCKKDDAQVANSPNPNVTNFGQMNVSANFDWEAAHDNELTINGLPTDVDSKHFLLVKNPDGVLVKKQWASIQEDYTLSFELADQYDFVTVQFGSIEKRVEMKNRKGQFDYTVDDDRSDLDPADR